MMKSVEDGVRHNLAHIDGRAELRKVDRAHEGQDDSHKKGDEADDSHSVRAALLHNFQQIDGPAAGLGGVFLKRLTRPAISCGRVFFEIRIRYDF